MKKRIISLAVALMCLTLMATTAQAHTGDYFGGKYVGGSINLKNLTLRVSSSARTALLTEEVYKSAYNWNNISSNIKISNIIMETPGMPSTSSTVMVYGADSGFLGDAAAGTLPYDKNGNSTSLWDSDWSYAEIYLNTDVAAYDGVDNLTLAAKKTFMHEVGHVLKLDHPLQNSTYEGHVYDGRPYAVMNQGAPFAKGGAVAPEVAQHDKNNLIAKWGS